MKQVSLMFVSLSSANNCCTGMLIRMYSEVSKMLLIYLMLVLLNLAASEDNSDKSTPNRNRKRIVSDPVANFFSELGDLVLDVDRAIVIQAQPKIEHEETLVSQIFRPRADYFERIQQNYRDVQKRLGKLIGNTIGYRSTYSDHELSTVSPPLANPVPNIRADYNPFAAAAEERKNKLKKQISESPSPNYECSKEKLEDPELEKFRLEKCSHISNDQEKNSFEVLRPRAASDIDFSESVKAFRKLSKSLFDRLVDASKKTDESKSHSRVEKDSLKERTGSLDPSNDECFNEIIADPVLEYLRKERCTRIATKEKTRSDFKKIMLEPKRLTEALISRSSKAFDQFSKGILGRSDLPQENDVSLPTEASETTETSSKLTIDECSDETFEDPIVESQRKEKCARIAAEEKVKRYLSKLIEDSKLSSEVLIPASSKAIDDLSAVLIRRIGDSESEDKPESGIVSDILYSESFFDKHMRQLLKDHGQWILDNPLLNRWRQSSNDNVETDSSNVSEATTLESTSDITTEIEPTEVFVPVSTEYEIAIPKSGEFMPNIPLKSSYYTIVNDGGEVAGEEVDIVLDPESVSNEITEVANESKDTVILAFTSDGMPLKLRMGPEIDNPLRYLHKMLKSAGVSLNVPVESYDDLEPVGKEVLKLGSGILTRAVLIDISNNNEFKSLLKALIATKVSGRTVL